MCDPPIGTMEREYEVAITVFTNVQRLPQINQTAGENTHWGGSTFVGVGPSISTQQPHKTNVINKQQKREVCDPPIGTMEREYEVAITIFSIVRRLPQINQTAGENTHWGGSDLVGGGS